jgi:hypothetical protein
MTKLKYKRVWDVAFTNKDGKVIDITQIDEKKASLAWELFEEFGHTKQKGDKILWQPDWEEIEE